jgi:hypothetical protein
MKPTRGVSYINNGMVLYLGRHLKIEAITNREYCSKESFISSEINGFLFNQIDGL